MARETALFTTSANNLHYYPKTPFQVLYITDATSSTVDGGLKFTGTKSFTVSPGTSFYVPLLNVDDSPPIIGTFPEHASDAARYFFGSD